MTGELKMPNTRIILVRHGQSTYNAQKRYQGSCDRSELTDVGMTQALLTGQTLAVRKIDAVYSSPLKRALQTAELIISRLDSPNLTAIPQAHLREIDLPAWAGLPFQQVQTDFPEDYQCWQERPQTFCMTAGSEPGTESEPTANAAIAVLEKVAAQTFPVRDLYDRAQRFWQKILQQHSGETVLVVSHGGTIRALVSTALGIAPDQFHYLQQSNCGITTLEFDASGQASLLEMNLENHTGKVLPKLKNGKQGIRLLLAPADHLTDELNQQLATFLQSETIDLSLSSTASTSQHTAQILKHHSRAVHLEINQSDFPLVWQRMILSQPDRVRTDDPKRPMTALVVANDRVLHKLLGKTLGMIDWPETTISFQSGTFSSVFYPATIQHPVIQAINVPTRPSL
jgi:phosphoserine phosphatase